MHPCGHFLHDKYLRFEQRLKGNYMLKKCLFVGVLVSHLVLYSGPKVKYGIRTVNEVCEESGIGMPALMEAKLYGNVVSFVNGYQRLENERLRAMEIFNKKTVKTPTDCRQYQDQYNIIKKRQYDYWTPENYSRFLGALRNDYQNYLARKQKEEVEQQQALKKAEQERKKQQLEQQTTLLAIQKEQMVQAQRIERLIAGNNQFISFLVMMELKVSSEQEANERLLAAEQLLKADLVDEQNKVLLLNNKLKTLKEQLDSLAVENESLRKKMLSLLAQMQATLKEKILSLM